MSAKITTSAKRETLNVRLKAEDRGLFDQAAHLLGKSRTDFLLDAARIAAQNAVLDQTFFKVNDKVFDAFVKRLDAPPAPNERLRRSMTIPAPWDK
jgi:uncharacterized protein (DUF1778 family)